jgi:hypothetical protein
MLKLEATPRNAYNPCWDSMGAYLGDYSYVPDAKTAGARFQQTSSGAVLDFAHPINQMLGNCVVEDDIQYVDDGSHLSQTPTFRHYDEVS